MASCLILAISSGSRGTLNISFILVSLTSPNDVLINRLGYIVCLALLMHLDEKKAILDEIRTYVDKTDERRKVLDSLMEMPRSDYVNKGRLAKKVSIGRSSAGEIITGFDKLCLLEKNSQSTEPTSPGKRDRSEFRLKSDLATFTRIATYYTGSSARNRKQFLQSAYARSLLCNSDKLPFLIFSNMMAMISHIEGFQEMIPQITESRRRGIDFGQLKETIGDFVSYLWERREISRPDYLLGLEFSRDVEQKFERFFKDGSDLNRILDLLRILENPLEQLSQENGNSTLELENSREVAFKELKGFSEDAKRAMEELCGREIFEDYMWIATKSPSVMAVLCVTSLRETDDWKTVSEESKRLLPVIYRGSNDLCRTLKGKFALPQMRGHTFEIRLGLLTFVYHALILDLYDNDHCFDLSTRDGQPSEDLARLRRVLERFKGMEIVFDPERRSDIWKFKNHSQQH